jgi:DNA-binding SARP family transcriptional activator
MEFVISVLGPFQASYGGQPLAFATGATRALLAYLAIEAGRPHPREQLAALLWPEQPQAAAFANLRQTLARLRKALPEPAAQLLLVTPQALQLPAGRASLDLAQFDALLAAVAGHAHADAASCLLCRERLRQAAALYRGELLHGLALEGSQPFGEWLLVRREQLHQRALGLFHSLAEAYAAAGDYPAMRDCAARQIELEPWHEQAYRQLMRALALAGDRDSALAQFQRCRQVLASELGLAPDAETRALAERIRAGHLTPATRSAAAPRHNLPAALTAFVGREAELATLAALCGQPGARLLTLVGMGGVGKTSLALELARASLESYADGVFFVPLAPLAGPATIAPAVAQALELSVQAGDVAAALLRFLRDKHILLILDNFEHLLAEPGQAVELVVGMLEAAPRVQIVATSRERLNLRAEQLVALEGLSYEPGAAPGDAADLPAVRLFAQSARRVRLGFELGPANLPDVLQICRLVQGVPLALELAAAWAELLPLDEIAREIARSADFLAAKWHDAPERQRSLRAVFGWSWRLLSAGERQLFARLAVFRGGFTRAAAEAVVGASLPGLIALVQKSLLRRAERGASVRAGGGRAAPQPALPGVCRRARAAHGPRRSARCGGRDPGRARQCAPGLGLGQRACLARAACQQREWPVVLLPACGALRRGRAGVWPRRRPDHGAREWRRERARRAGRQHAADPAGRLRRDAEQARSGFCSGAARHRAGAGQRQPRRPGDRAHGSGRDALPPRAVRRGTGAERADP